MGTVQVAHAIALEATLSFLGLGLPTTEPSLGLLIANGYEYLLSGKYWISVYPGIALLLNAHAQVSDAGGKIVFTGVRGLIAEVLLERCRLDLVLTLAPTIDAAVVAARASR